MEGEVGGADGGLDPPACLLLYLWKNAPVKLVVHLAPSGTTNCNEQPLCGVCFLSASGVAGLAKCRTEHASND